MSLKITKLGFSLQPQRSLLSSVDWRSLTFWYKSGSGSGTERKDQYIYI